MSLFALCRVAAVLFVLAGWFVPARAQVEESLHLHQDGVCSFFSEPLPSRVTLFSSDSEAERLIKSIIRASGLVPNFVVRAGGVANAVAVIRGERRYVIYNQFFVHNLTQKTGDHWAAISVLAHEIGHHLNGHTLAPITDRYRTELEADYYSGFVLQRLGASLEDARRAIELFGNHRSTATHPARHDRLAAVTNGWISSCHSEPTCRKGAAALAETPGGTVFPGTNAPVSVVALSPAGRPPMETPAPGTAPAGAAPAGTAIRGCGCWGFNPPLVMHEPRCQSARVRVDPCPASCASGGQSYSYVCS